MSYFPGLKLTKAGEQLLAKVNGNLNETINFKRAELGSGVINTDDEIRFLTMLKEKWKDVKISECKIVGTDKTQVQIELQFDNADISSNKIFRELGIYAATNDDEEILFAYSNAKENFDYIPAVTDNPQSFVINILITITSNTKVDAQIDLNSYVTLRKLQEELDKKLDKGAVSTEYDTAKKIEDKIENLIKTKEPSITKNTAFNKDFGTSEDEVLEGAKLAETLGIPYGGILNNSNTKTEGTAYYDSTTKKTYKCTVTNTLNYADASKYEAISNNDLLLKFQNLVNKKFEYIFPLFDEVVGNSSGSSSAPTQEYSFPISVPIPLTNVEITTYINRNEASDWTNYPGKGMTLDGIYSNWECKRGINKRIDKVSKFSNSILHGQVGYGYLYSNGNWYEPQKPLTITVTITGQIF